MEIKCPTCDHRGTERLALSYAKGDSRSRSVSAHVTAGLGFLLNPIGILKSAFFGLLTIGRIWGHSQTTLASETEPPRKYRYWLVIPLFLALKIFWGLVVGPFASSPDELASWVIVLAKLSPGALVIGYLAYALYYNLKVWPKKETSWQKTFLCRRCGTVFEEQDFEIPDAVRSDERKKGRFLPKISRD